MSEDQQGSAQWAFVRAVELYENDAEVAEVGAALRQARRDLSELTDLAVARAVERKRSWTEIGRGLGVSRQAVQQKYDQG